MLHVETQKHFQSLGYIFFSKIRGVRRRGRGVRPEAPLDLPLYWLSAL